MPSDVKKFVQRMSAMADVYFFDEPTIGYCKECELIATWDEELGLYCPGCESTKISIFEWDGESEYPE